MLIANSCCNLNFTISDVRVFPCVSNVSRSTVSNRFPIDLELAFDKGVTAIVGPNWLRQEQRRRRHHLGDGRAEREEPARRQDGRRDLQRQRCAASRPRPPKCGCGSAAVLKTVERVPRFRRDAVEATANGNGHRERQRPRQRRTATATATVTMPLQGSSGHGPTIADVVGIARDHPVGRPRGRGHAAAVSLGRERIPDRRRRSAACATSTIC